MAGAHRGVCLFVLVFTTILLAGGGVRADINNLKTLILEHIPALGQDHRHPKVAASLKINRSELDRLIVAGKCQGEGEEDLRRLASSAAVEESYLFIPGLCLWIEVGFQETTKSVQIDGELIENIIEHYPAIALYHIHLDTPRGVPNVFPAYSDLLSTVLLNAKFSRRPEVKIRHLAVTSHGTVEYMFLATPMLDRFNEAISRSGLEAFASQNLAYEMSRNTHRESYFRAVEACKETSGGWTGNIADCFPLRSDDFFLEYRPVAVTQSR